MKLRWLMTIVVGLALAGGIWLAVGGRVPTIAQAEAESPGPDIRKLYPGLLDSYDSAAARWNRMVPEQPMELIRVLHGPADGRDIRFANLWLMSRMLSAATSMDNCYPAGTFSDITDAPLAGQAYVLVRMGSEKSLIVFSPMPQAPGRWQRGLIAPLETIRKLGGALALAQDLLQAARDGELLDPCADGLRGRWLDHKPQSWRMLGIRDITDRTVSLFEIEQRVASARKLRLGLWITTQTGRHQGLNLELSHDPHREGWAGWRVTDMTRVQVPAVPRILEP